MRGARTVYVGEPQTRASLTATFAEVEELRRKHDRKSRLLYLPPPDVDRIHVEEGIVMTESHHGTHYQRCGGGRRVVRKRVEVG